jgi:diaminopimelate decarboxylase
MTNALEIVKAEVRKQTTEMIKMSVIQMGGGHMDEYERLVRAALIDVYFERTSEAEGDKLMEFIGL